MRKEYTKALNNLFEKEMRERLPQFDLKKIKSTYLWPGEQPYLWSPLEDVHLYVILSPGLKGDDEFSLDIAWSKKGRFPEIGARAAGTPLPGYKEFESSKFACRLTTLANSQQEFWRLYDKNLLTEDPVKLMFLQAATLTREDAERAVSPLVKDAVNLLVVKGIPYFEAFIESLRS
jgi:hypothetical protein